MIFRPKALVRLMLPLAVIAGAALLLSACSGSSNNATSTSTPPAATSTVAAPASTTPAAGSTVPAATATSAPTVAAPTSTPPAAGPKAPGDVTISGALPDLNTPVPPGEGEQGRITVKWTDNSDDETGFRIYQDCQGNVSPMLETEANTTQYGPLQSCRPGRVGVASFNASGTSAIVWAS
ncbi:MAG TPA: hypothetical protein VFY10_16415 [Dehalococcoidia bacterium]|nr:hypothetical protein [Dehalococcoidia bacterium]